VSGGVLFTDDVLFHGLVQQEGTVAHKHRTIVNNLRKYIQAASNDADFDTKLYEIEDGVCVSVKK
jgi:predicted O-methyltransferase YrrM